MSALKNSTWTPPWEQSEWRASVDSWIHLQLEELNFSIIGPITQPHIRPWSTVLHIPTNRGDIYFKAGAPNQAFEPALLQALNRWSTGTCIPILAADTDRGWMLMPDGGNTLRQLHKNRADLKRWEQILPMYALLQIETARHAQEILDLGCPDRRVSTLPSKYRALLNDLDALRIGKPEGLTAEEYKRLQDFEDQFSEKCAQLEAFDIPAAIDHGDLHDANVLTDGAEYTLFDWGDASLTHPFFSLIIVLRVIANTLKTEVYDPQLTWVRDAYLEAWTGIASRKDLVAAFDLAHHVGKFARSLNWYALVTTLDPASVSDYLDTVPGWLWEFLNHKMG